MGGVSTTTETDVDAVVKSNFRLSTDLWKHCAERSIPLIYASSAATYGDGRGGFEDRADADYLSRLRPLSPYAWSKHLFDRWVSRVVETGAPAPPRWAGLKFFNVYGPNEYHKGGQRSVAVQLHAQIRRVRPCAPVSFGKPGISRWRPVARLRVGRRLRRTQLCGRFSIRPRRPACTTSAPATPGPSSTSQPSCSQEMGSGRRTSSSSSRDPAGQTAFTRRR